MKHSLRARAFRFPRTLATVSLLACASLLGSCLADDDASLGDALDDENEDFRMLEPIAPCIGSIEQECIESDYCGDGVCGGTEGIFNCPYDCGHCGDGFCSSIESTKWCSTDCGSACGDKVCNGAESVANCLTDCGPSFDTVLLDRVRRCRNNAPWPCNSKLNKAEFHWWEDFGVSNDKQKRTYIARAWDPGYANVRHLVFLAAGQQNDVFDDDSPSLITGQLNGYKNGFGRTTGTKEVALHQSSLARRLAEELHVELDETYIGLAFDARFNYDFTSANKAEIENAYYSWLSDRFQAAQLESVYLAGHSRGGCLVMRLAQRFNYEYPDVPLIVHVFDGVCKYSNGELGLGSATISNPIATGDFYARAVDMRHLFYDTSKLRVLNFVSGASVIADLPLGVGDGIRAFAHIQQGSGGTVTIGDWYEQRWNKMGHNAIGLSPSLVGTALVEYNLACAELGC